MEPIREGEVHPLQNQVILEKIFEGLTLAELRVCRQVCKEWLVAGSKAMKGSVKINACRSVFYEDADSSLYNFFTVLDNELSTLAACPLADTFKLGLSDGFMPSKFWEDCGSYIKSLELENAVFSFAADFYRAVFVSCPNLEKLALKYCKIGIHEDELHPSSFPELEGGGGHKNLKSLVFYDPHDNKCTVSWTEFFSHCPSLKSLDVKCYSKSDDLFRSLEEVRRDDGRTCNLNKLEFDFGFLSGRYDRIIGLLNTCLALETLEIHGFTVPQDVAAMQRILETCACTLKNLCVYSGKPDRFQLIDSLVLPDDGRALQLQELKLWRPLMPSMKFLRTFPNLRKLVLVFLSNTMLENTREMRETGNFIDFVLPSCTELELCFERNREGWGGPGELEAGHVRMLGMWLPNLEKLKVQELKSSTFTVICEQWPKLTSLRSLWGRLDDSAFTGLDLTDVQRINEEGKTGNWRPIERQWANITSLKNLEVLSFSLSFSTYQGYATLGYCSAVCGIQQLPRLKQLRLHGLEKSRHKEIWGSYLAKFPWKIRESY